MSANETKNPTDEKAMREDTEAFVAQMRKIATGEIASPNETVTYLLNALKETQAESEAAQKQMVTLQETLVKLQGRAAGIEVDLKHFWDKSAKE